MSLDSFLLLAADADSGGNIFKSFGVHWAPFIAQLVNFFLICLVLKKFAFGPVQDILEKRRKRIEDGEEKLRQVEQQIAESEKRTAAAIQEANERAKRLVDEAKESATALGEKKAQEATAAAQTILAKAEEAAKSERDKMRVELKREFGRLVTATTAQVTGKVLTADDQKRINEEALAKVEG
jgi:F-type H+-transporting ATPase subunit b